MTPEESERVMDLFAAALACAPGEERAALLRRECADDDAVRAEVESLLSVQGETPDFLDKPIFTRGATLLADEAAASGGELEPGDTLGDCRVVSLLGVGGMGEVYLADDTVLGRRVALKLLLSHGRGDALLRHFRHERRVLAGLNHPHIARLYGGAVTPEGRPYLVMEYVEGERLDDYCQRHALGVPERLALFRKVCAAVAYAHQNLVIHRDLKPANIRVTPEGEPKLLDFGIAKLLDADHAGTVTSLPTMTLTLQGMMTPEYASPEQLKGEAITTASDVYSLGVVLFELLTGQRPYHLKGRRPDEVIHAVCETELARVSTVAARPAGIPAFKGPPLPAGKLRRLLSGDLDNIVAKALRKEPLRRYGSAALLSEDIRRHLDGVPVQARPDTLPYRAGKFLRRNKVGVAAAALVALALVGGLITTVREARRANRRFDDVRRLADSILFEIEPQIAYLAGSTQARATLVKRSLEYLDSLSREAGGNRDLRLELAAAYQKVGNIQGNPNVANLGDIKGALVSFAKAKTICLDLVKADGRDAQARHRLADVDEDLGSVLWWNDDTAGALADYREALPLRRALLAEQPRSVEFRRGFASLLMSLADVTSWNGQFPETLASLHEALPVLQALADERPGDTEAHINVARGYARLGVAHRDAGDLAAAEDDFNHGQGIVDPIAQREPNNHSAQIESWYLIYCKCQMYNGQPGVGKALTLGPRMIGLAAAMSQADPRNATCGHNLAESHSVYGETLLAARRWREGIEQMQQGLAIDTALGEQSPENGEYPHSCGVYHMNIGEAYLRLGQLADADREETTARALLGASAAKDPENPVPYRESLKALRLQGDIREARQQPAEARRYFQDAATGEEALAAKGLANKEDARDLAALHAKLAAPR